MYIFSFSFLEKCLTQRKDSLVIGSLPSVLLSHIVLNVLGGGKLKNCPADVSV